MSKIKDKRRKSSYSTSEGSDNEPADEDEDDLPMWEHEEVPPEGAKSYDNDNLSDDPEDDLEGFVVSDDDEEKDVDAERLPDSGEEDDQTTVETNRGKKSKAKSTTEKTGRPSKRRKNAVANKRLLSDNEGEEGSEVSGDEASYDNPYLNQ